MCTWIERLILKFWSVHLLKNYINIMEYILKFWSVHLHQNNVHNYGICKGMLCFITIRWKNLICLQLEMLLANLVIQVFILFEN